MKKIVTMLLFALLFLLSACAPRASEPPSGSGAQSETSQASGSSAVIEPHRERSDIADQDNSDAATGYPLVASHDAEAYLQQFNPAVFGFPIMYETSTTLYIEDITVNSFDCYRIRMEVSYPDGDAMYDDVFIRKDLSAIYMFDEETQKYFEITDFEYEGPQGYPAENAVVDDGPLGYPEGGEDEAIAMLQRYSSQELDLPAELDEYVLQVDGEQEIEGTRCHIVGAYADLGERMTLMGSYYVAFDNSVVFTIDPQNGGYKALPAR